MLLIGAMFMLLASACAPQAAPTANPVDIQQTAEAAAFTMVAETQLALPSPTPVPPTATPTSAPTNTPPPLPTLGTPGTQVVQGTAVTPAPGGLPTTLPTPTAPPASSNTTNNQDICNQPLTSWQGPTANFSIVNQTRPEGTIILSMYVVTPFNQCGYLLISGNSFSGPIGDYSAGAFITGRQNLKAFGSFRITEGNWSIVVRNDSILAKGGCAPNC